MMKIKIILLLTFFSACAHRPPEVDERKAISSKLSESSPQFQNCYQSELNQSKTPKDVSGILQMQFTIDATGKATETNFIGDPSFTSGIKDCIGKVLKEIQFQIPQDGSVQINQSFRFTPVKIKK